MNKKMKVGAVSYLNTKPLIYGFEHGMMREEVDLIIDYPANIASELLSKRIDIGLVPVAIIPDMVDYYIISDYCIGSKGEVASVSIFSEVPMSQIKTVLLDYQSRTSVKLAQILLKEYWKITPQFTPASKNFISKIKDTTAAVVIGDRALEQRLISAYQYDLGEAWLNYKGLPFVFAAWISNKKLPDEFAEKFNNAVAAGLTHIDEIVRMNPYPIFDLKKYYTEHISYTLTDQKREGLTAFLKYFQQQ